MLGNPAPQQSQSAIDELRHRLAMQQPQPGLPFGKQKVAPNQWMPFDIAGEPWRGPDPQKLNLGRPMIAGTALEFDPTFNAWLSPTPKKTQNS